MHFAANESKLFQLPHDSCQQKLDTFRHVCNVALIAVEDIESTQRLKLNLNKLDKKKLLNE